MLTTSLWCPNKELPGEIIYWPSTSWRPRPGTSIQPFKDRYEIAVDEMLRPRRAAADRTPPFLDVPRGPSTAVPVLRLELLTTFLPILSCGTSTTNSR